MRKYLLSILLIGFWGCGDNEESTLCDSSLTDELKSFADENWTLDNWVNRRFIAPTHMHESMGWNNFDELTTFSGERDLKLVVSGDLAALLNITMVSSDSLDTHPEWYYNYSGDVSILRDSMFYVNIGRMEHSSDCWSFK